MTSLNKNFNMKKPFIKSEDTITAIATPPGMGGIGIVRLSGPRALSIADRMFVSTKKKPPSTFASHTVHYGHVVHKGTEGVIDEVLLTVMRAPHSYTCEDVVEISCHGGRVPLQAILHLAVSYGARLAEPGEFTKRAFLNGRLDLIQAEAVLDVIQSRTDAFLRVSTNQLKGELTRQLEDIRAFLMTVYAEIEAFLNFPDEDIKEADQVNILEKFHQAQKRIKDLMASARQGRLLKEGVKLVICGKVNVGKSSLLNVLVQEPRAIVSKVAGTTRDTLEEVVQLGGFPLNVVDTAGILMPRNAIEKEALQRSRLQIKSADLILFMLDASRVLSQDDRKLIKEISGTQVLVVINKVDLPQKLDMDKVRRLLPTNDIVHISALTKEGIGSLKKKILALIDGGRSSGAGQLVISNMRHLESLMRCDEALAMASHHLHGGMSFEFVCEDLKESVKQLDRITGRAIDKDLLDQIFSSFCVGK